MITNKRTGADLLKKVGEEWIIKPRKFEYSNETDTKTRTVELGHALQLAYPTMKTYWGFDLKGSAFIDQAWVPEMTNFFSNNTAGMDTALTVFSSITCKTIQERQITEFSNITKNISFEDIKKDAKYPLIRNLLSSKNFATQFLEDYDEVDEKARFEMLLFCYKTILEFSNKFLEISGEFEDGSEHGCHNILELISKKDQPKTSSISKERSNFSYYCEYFIYISVVLLAIYIKRDFLFY